MVKPSMWRVRRSLYDSWFSRLSQARRSEDGIYDWDCRLLWLRIRASFRRPMQASTQSRSSLRQLFSPPKPPFCEEIAPTLRSERPYHAHQSLSTIIETLVCLGVFGDKDQRQRDLTEGEVFGFTHRELVGPMTHAGFKFQSRQAFFTRCLNALYVFGC